MGHQIWLIFEGIDGGTSSHAAGFPTNCVLFPSDLGQPCRKNPEIPLTGEGLVQILSTRGNALLAKSRQRMSGVGSDPLYEGQCILGEIPPTDVGGWFRSSLREAMRSWQNPANGSWGLVQILSTEKQLSLPPAREARGRESSVGLIEMI